MPVNIRRPYGQPGAQDAEYSNTAVIAEVILIRLKNGPLTFAEAASIIAMDRLPCAQLRASRFARSQTLQGEFLRHPPGKRFPKDIQDSKFQI
ncbi:MAG TPA: hypothetical protein VFJ52_07290 [Terriglobia bacterium]|nr:hypothetical protein [Terriglobia bacterium]